MTEVKTGSQHRLKIAPAASLGYIVIMRVFREMKVICFNKRKDQLQVWGKRARVKWSFIQLTMYIYSMCILNCRAS